MNIFAARKHEPMKNILSALRILTFLFFLAALVLSYSYMPGQVEAFSSGSEVQSISKASFFYISIGIFMLINLVFTALAGLIDKAAYKEGGFYRSMDHKQAISNWFKIENLLINALITFIVIFLAIFNNPESVDPAGYEWLIYLSLSLVALWLLQLLRLLFSSK